MTKKKDNTTVVKPDWLGIEHLQPRTGEGAPIIVLGTANAFNAQSALNDYNSKRMCPHATLDIDTGQLYQHIPFEFAALTVPEHTAFKPAFTTTSYWIMLGCLAGHVLTEKQVKVVAATIKDLAKKLDVPLQFSEFPPPQSSTAISSVLNSTQWDEIGGVVSSSITQNCQWHSIQQGCADAIQIELKLKKGIEIPTPDEVEFVKPEVDEDAEAAKAAEAEENDKVTGALEEMIKASEEKKPATKKKAAPKKKEEPKEEPKEESDSE